MKLFLSLKSWQLFSITWGIPILIYLVVFYFLDPMSTILLFPFAFPFLLILFTFGYLGWIWTISVHFNNQLPKKVNLNIRLFKFSFSIAIIFIFLIILLWIIALIDFIPILPSEKAIFIIFPLFIGSFAIIIWSIGFAAQTLKSIELKRKASFMDSYGEFLLIWFSIIGYWILQPKINERVKKML